MHVKEDDLTNEEGIEILQKLVAIENHFEVRIVRPDEIYEADMKKIDFLFELITRGYSEKLSIGKEIDFNTNECEWMKQLYDNAVKDNRVRICHNGKYECVLFGTRIKMNVAIISEVYAVDIADLRYKIESYRAGDSRNIKLAAAKKAKTYFILDTTKVDENMFATDCITIGIKHMGINNDFIHEL